MTTTATTTPTASWKRLRSGEWGAAGHNLVEGEKVYLVRRDGDVSCRRVTKIVWTDGENCIAAVAEAELPLDGDDYRTAVREIVERHHAAKVSDAKPAPAMKPAPALKPGWSNAARRRSGREVLDRGEYRGRYGELYMDGGKTQIWDLS